MWQLLYLPDFFVLFPTPETTSAPTQTRQSKPKEKTTHRSFIILPSAPIPSQNKKMIRKQTKKKDRELCHELIRNKIARKLCCDCLLTKPHKGKNKKRRQKQCQFPKVFFFDSATSNYTIKEKEKTAAKNKSTSFFLLFSKQV